MGSWVCRHFKTSLPLKLLNKLIPNLLHKYSVDGDHQITTVFSVSTRTPGTSTELSRLEEVLVLSRVQRIQIKLFLSENFFQSMRLSIFMRKGNNL